MYEELAPAVLGHATRRRSSERPDAERARGALSLRTSLRPTDVRSGGAPGQVERAGDPCRGKPPWAGVKDKPEKDRLKAEHAAVRAVAGCPMDAEEPEPAG